MSDQEVIDLQEMADSRKPDSTTRMGRYIERTEQIYNGVSCMNLAR